MRKELRLGVAVIQLSDLENVDIVAGPSLINIVPDIGGIARKFAWGFGGKSALQHAFMVGFDVNGFEGMSMAQMAGAMGGYGMLCDTGVSCNNNTTSGDVTNDNFLTGSGYELLPDNFESAVLGTAMWQHGITGELGSYKDADVMLLLYQVRTADELTLNTLCGLVEFSFGQEVSNSNPNELEFADELWKYKYFS